MDSELAIRRSSVHLNGFLTDVKRIGQSLIAHALSDHANHFAFASGKVLKARLKVRKLFFIAPMNEVCRNGLINRFLKRLLVHGLLQKVDGADL